MNTLQAETITKAAQTADLLVSDLIEASKMATTDSPALEILLRDLVSDALKIENRLNELYVRLLEMPGHPDK